LNSNDTAAGGQVNFVLIVLYFIEFTIRH